MEIPASRTFRRLVHVLPAIVLLLASCGGWAFNPYREAAQPGVLEISVKNQGLQDVRVTLLSELGPRVVGVIGGNTDRGFRLSWRRHDRVSFRLEPLVGTSYTTESISISPGDHIELIIPAELVHTLLRRR